MTRCNILIALTAACLPGATLATAQQYRETDYNFVSRLTESTTSAFQKKKKLSADGIVGPKTWAPLQSASILSEATVISSAFDLATGAAIAGRSIAVDDQGRIKVVFHFDRAGSGWSVGDHFDTSDTQPGGSAGPAVDDLQGQLNRNGVR